LLGKKVISLANTSLEQIVVLHDELNVVNWQVNKHSRDLGSFLADQLVNEFVENGANLVFVVGVLCNDSWEDGVGSHDVLLVNGQLLSLLLLSLDLLLLLLLLDLLHLNHLLLAAWLLLLLRLCTTWHLLHVLELTTLVVELHLSSAHHGVSVLVLVLVLSIAFRVASLVTSVTSLLVLLEVSVLAGATGLSHGSLLLHQERHALNEKLEIVLELFLVSKISPLCTL